MNHATTVQATEFYNQQYQKVAGSLPGSANPVVTAGRQSAMEALQKYGFPTSRDENWKYTPLVNILKREFNQPAIQSAAVTSAWKSSLLVKKHVAHLVFVDGVLDYQESSFPEEKNSIHIKALNEYLDASNDIESALFSLPEATQRTVAFQSLNTALMSTGVVIEIAQNFICENPVYLTYVGTGNAQAQHIRNTIRLNAGSSASIIEQYTGSETEAAFTNTVTYINAGDNARCTHYKVQEEAHKKYHLSSIQVDQGRGSVFKSFSLALGGALSKTDITVRQNAQGCETVLDGLIVGNKRQYMDHHTCVEHQYPNGISDECYRGVMDDASRGVFNGRVVVHPQAQKTNASQSNKNLLLSNKAEIDTKPELEIYADDVKCAHGATVGQLDPDRLFYLQSRGIDGDTAYILLIFAFLEDVITRLDNQELRKSIERSIIERLPSGEILRDALVMS